MPSSRNIASRAPRLPLARQASAFFTMRSFSAALNVRLGAFLRDGLHGGAACAARTLSALALRRAIRV